MFRVLLAALVMAAAATGVALITGAERWVVSVGLLVLGVGFYALNSILIRRFIQRRAPELASTEESIVEGVRDWELTAGVGIVPRWVSWLGILGIGALLAAIVPWVMALFA